MAGVCARIQRVKAKPVESKIIKQIICVGSISATNSKIKIVIIAEHWPSWYYTSLGLGWRIMGTCVKNDVGLERLWGSIVAQYWISWVKRLNIVPLLVDDTIVCMQ